ncbi:MAG: DNA repair protein RecN [Actinomycetota bacterium]
MLLELHLAGLGVIADAQVTFAPGLNVVTGETGVVKTLLITSLGLLTGARGNARLVSTGDEATVQAVIARGDWTPDEIDGIDDVLLVRRLGADGRSRAWVDGRLVPLSVLGEIGERLVEVHGQGAGFALAGAASQLAAVDALARNEAVLERYRTSLATLRDLERELHSLETDAAARERELDVLGYQLAEIDRAGLSVDEEEHIASAIPRLEHSERLSETGDEVARLVGSEGAAGELAQAHKMLDGAQAIDATLQPLVSRLADVSAEAAELARDVRAWGEVLASDPHELERLRERKALISSLKRKFGSDVTEILAFADAARERIAALEGSDDAIASLERRIDGARVDVSGLADDLSKRRAKAGKRLTKMVSSELPALALTNATFSVEIERGEPTESGADRVTFLFSSSRSRPAEPIGKIASGGELSRAMVAVTLALARAHRVPVLVFDEADQGVGGQAALELGRRLQRLGGSHQVLVVSHLPQIAAFADRHIAIRRDGDAVRIDVLGEAERLAEISRMLAGLEGSDLAKAHAGELIDLAASERASLAATAEVG